MADEVIVGIDLGTTYSCVAVVIDDEVKIIPNHQSGRNIMPSYVQFTERERLVGDIAKESLAIADVVYDSKRMLGRSFQDAEIQHDIKKWPFKVISKKNKPMIQVSTGAIKEHPPELVSALILEDLKKTAEQYLGVSVSSAVITVPARFNMSQKQATIDAAKIAGLKVKRLIMEPTAAAIAYGNQRRSNKKCHVLVYDLGGGTFDVSVVKIDGNDIEVLATGGDTHLGGEDFDNSLVEHFVKRFIKDDEDLATDDNRKVRLEKEKKIAIRRLKQECEKAKQRLSTARETYLSIDFLYDGKHFHEQLSRQRFESLNEDLFEGTITTVEDTLKYCSISPEKIDEVILIGGSTRIPKIGEMLKDFFKGKTLNKQIHPDEAVAYGAAIFADKLKGSNRTTLMKDFNLKDIIPFSIGTDLSSGEMSIGIKRNTEFPTVNEKTYKTVEDYQNMINFNIYEGERIMACDNQHIGHFQLEGLQSKLAERVRVNLIYKIDENGILDLTAKEISTSNESNLKIAFNTGRMNSRQMKEMLEQAEKYREEDKKKAEIMKEKSDLEKFCFNMKNRAKSQDFKISEEERESIIKICKNTLEWLDEHKTRDISDIRDKMKIMKEHCKKIIV